MMSLVGWAIRRAQLESMSPEPVTPGIEALKRFVSGRSATLAIDLVARFGGDFDRLDPRAALPSWHSYPREQAVAVHRATRACGGVAPEIRDRALAKWLEWHDDACRDLGSARDRHVGTAPFMAPSGDSYAKLAIMREPATARWVAANKAFFHVSELSALDPALLDEDDRALASLASSARTRILAGDPAVLDDGWLAWVERDQAGPTALRLFARSEWDRYAREHGLELEAGSGSCAVPATAALCWRAVPLVKRHGTTLLVWLIASLSVLCIAIAALLFNFVAARRAAARDRVLVLRTLTHELRTPATSMRLDVEPLRAAYDEIPANCQESVIRLVDGVARLNRALHLSARYLELFDPDASAPVALRIETFASAAEYLESLRDEWPEGVELAGGQDGALTTDGEWLSVALRNLVHNADRHGAKPVRVAWRLEHGSLIVRVSDAGATLGLALADVTSPFRGQRERGELGLGLAIVARVAELLGGGLRHEPDPTCFELSIRAEGQA